MMHKLQKAKILDLLKENRWVCVSEIAQQYIVDYRRRLVDIQRMGYELESRRCTQHSFHAGGSKEWKLIGSPKVSQFIPIIREDGTRAVREVKL